MEVHRPMVIKPGELRCPRCLGRDLVRSLPRGVGDLVMRQFDRIPRHCRSCGKRFHVHISRLPPAERPAPLGE